MLQLSEGMHLTSVPILFRHLPEAEDVWKILQHDGRQGLSAELSKESYAHDPASPISVVVTVS